ncbi:MAG: 2OG-Fe(II) oxygenase [Nitrospirales bacterium]
MIVKAKHASTHPTTVAAQGTQEVKGDIRRASKVEMADQRIEPIERKLRTLMPTLQEYFGIIIARPQPIQVLQYHPGDFYRVHEDNGNLRINEVGKTVPPSIADRQLTVVFLNGEADSRDTESFSGGDLVLHSKASLNNLVDLLLPISAKPGLLVAFSSSTLHEVIPVHSGIRYSIVSWFE